ncbi:hypothetical protein PCANC_07106 [Puccinia coronata f. sp. avenae]|uniref:Protein YOP1 n=1 Tax=Puccinia coronata f. sp. avenae TaxID=200324 RepID=A0A2N5RXI7_9BASI|nr:hypothetical protein PCASD_25756 [Puccinia coronata f. sp. avenae]PLW10478.1 hypothetical protein PCANC_22682 [Puccinia coronata f. sp. avenae]PLW37786.1 hypothetical protein PCASD_11320 [Puccinia coronata f. sp. avenae]PLW49899.1 hypothetical protein PCANC_07106 [Puccinia coronata f. sp. avenae]
MSTQDKFNHFIAQIDKELSKYPALSKLEQKLQVPKAYGVLALGGLFSIFIFFNLFAGFLTNALGYGLPAYFSIQALESPSSGDDVQWLTYWTVFGFFTIIENFSDLILFWFPFYYTFKCIFIVWLMLPQTRGAQTMYQKALKPLVARTSSKKSSAAPETAPQ